MGTILLIGCIAAAAIFGLAILFSTIFSVDQQTVYIITRFSKFIRIAHAGLNLKIPFIEAVAGKLSLRVQALDVKVETKTRDNVFVHLLISVQYFVKPDRMYDAFYKLENPAQQITSFVFDVVRARVPKLDLDSVFEHKDEIADAVQKELSGPLAEFGFSLNKALVTDISPDAAVKHAMNEINVAQRLRVAANEKGEAEKILRVKVAEGEAQSKALQGKGIADQRRAIIEGLKSSVQDFKKAVEGSSAKEVMSLVLLTQYFDTLKEIGASSHTNTLLLPHSPSALGDLESQLRNALLSVDVSKNQRHNKKDSVE